MPELIPLRRGEPIFDSRGFGTRRFNEYIDLLTTSVNVTSSETGEITTQLAQVQKLISLVNDLIKSRESVTVTSAAYTALPFEIVICNNSASIEVTTPINPIVGDIVNVKRTNAEVIVKGQIDGVTDKTINVNYYSMKLVWSSSEWNEI